MPALRIGILGGTFDPPHNGHLALAEAAIVSLKLDEVLFIPNSRSPLKLDKTLTAARTRLEMVKLVAQSNPAFAVSDIEISKGGVSYTVDTLSELVHSQPAEYWFLIGSDAVTDLEQWKQPARLLKMCRLGVAMRPPFTVDQLTAKTPEFARSHVDFVAMPPIDVSSREIREKCEDGIPVAKLLPAPVLEYIQKNNLYPRK